MAKDVFVDGWDVEAPQEAVFKALADARTYPEKPVYIEVTGDSDPAIGCTTSQHFHNHNWSVKRAIEGFEPYACSHS
ncbi:MAG: hypothetical protein ACRDK5_05200 [Solirubrobacterales bacterium]